jgi:hypothetical protein
MPDTPDPGVPSVPEVRARLRDTARLMRESAAVDPDVRQAVADLLDELDRALAAPAGDPAALGTPPAEVARLAEGATHLAEALHRGHDRGILATARDRLERLVLQAEARAPTAVGLAQRLIDALATLGI